MPQQEEISTQTLWEFSAILDAYLRQQFGTRLPWDWQERLRRGEYAHIIDFE